MRWNRQAAILVVLALVVLGLTPPASANALSAAGNAGPGSTGSFVNAGGHRSVSPSPSEVSQSTSSPATVEMRSAHAPSGGGGGAPPPTTQPPSAPQPTAPPQPSAPSLDAPTEPASPPGGPLPQADLAPPPARPVPSPDLPRAGDLPTLEWPAPDPPAAAAASTTQLADGPTAQQRAAVRHDAAPTRASADPARAPSQSDRASPPRPSPSSVALFPPPAAPRGPVGPPSGGAIEEALVATAVTLLLAPLASIVLRLRRARILEHETRRRLHDAILRQPGMHVAEMTRELGLGRVVVQHHLRVLERYGFVASHAHGRTRNYYSAGHAQWRTSLRAHVLAKDPTRKRVMEVVRESPHGVTQAGVATAARISLRLASYHLSRLEAAGVVQSDKRRPQCYQQSFS